MERNYIFIMADPIGTRLQDLSNVCILSIIEGVISRHSNSFQCWLLFGNYITELQNALHRNSTD